MLKVLLWIWQLPQNLFGFVLSRRYTYKSIRYVGKDWRNVYFKPFFRSGISLGNYIILDTWYMGKTCSKETVAHEYGHCRQSLMLGWLYLILVGIPSITRNICDRIFHKKWSAERREQWYYNGYPEKWADKLGDVHRKE